jgi:signal transduction histidine kinase
MSRRGSETAPQRSAHGASPAPDDPQQLQSLRSQVGWFNRLRLLAAATVIWLTALGCHALEMPLPAWPLYGLGLLIAVIDAGYLVYYPRLLRKPLRSLRRHVHLQIAVDLSILTALLHFAGGITNPLILFYLFHAFIAALVLSVPAAVLVASASLVLVILLGFAERLGWVAHHDLELGLMDLSQVEPLGFLLLLLAYAMTMAFSIYFVATVLARLRANEAQLVRLGRHLALSEKLASLSTLAAGVSHEINNPVGVIRNKVQILRYRIQDGDSKDRLLQELDAVDKHNNRIAQITAGLLTFSRETPFELQPMGLSSLVREAVDLVRVPFRAADVRLATDLPAVDLMVRGSHNHLLQVLVNLLLNAKDASAAAAEVRVGCTSDGPAAVLFVEDHGSGIPDENLEKIFDPFFTTKDVDKGTGLGLAISHGIVERHGGRISVESAVGVGSTFRVLIPRLPETVAG